MSDGVELELGPGEVFEVPPGHDAWVLGDEPFVTVDFEAMRGFAQPQSESGRRTLASVLFTDIVDSTAQAVAIGPDRWRDTVSRHNEIAERLIVRNSGRLIKTSAFTSSRACPASASSTG